MQNHAARCKDFFEESTSSHHKGEKDGRQQGEKDDRAAAAAGPPASAATHERARAVVRECALRRGPAAVPIEVEGVSRHASRAGPPR